MQSASASIETRDAASRLAAAVVGRRHQLAVRVGLAFLIAPLFCLLTGVVPAAVWFVVYTAFQFAERWAFRGVTEATQLRRGSRAAVLAVMTLSNFIFATFGILEAVDGGIWGLLCAGLLWSGSILNGAMVSGDSRQALAASIGPPLLGFLIAPLFVIANGGTVAIGLLIVAAGILNAISVIAIWSASRRLMATAAREGETARVALLDPESGLANRYAFQRRLALLAKIKTGKAVVVVAIGIDRFEHLSGAIGHAATRDLIRAVAGRLATANRDDDVARLSTNVLGVALLVRDFEEARRAMLRVHAGMEAPVMLGDNPVDVSVTIGLTDVADSSHSGLSAIDRAILAVAQGRQKRQPVTRFDPALYGDPASNLSLMSEMLNALGSDEMNVHYQPKCDLKTGAMTGIEALVRWTHPQRGPLRPDEFLPMSEETGRIAALTEWVLRRSLRDQRHLHEIGFPVDVSVNLSGRLIGDGDFTRTLLALVAGAAGNITLEVTETAIIENLQAARRMLDTLRAAGIAISIDDYGSGLSSLGYLKHIPCDELKIDKTFVLHLADDHTDGILVRSVIDLAHSLGLKVVAEGVETEGALKRLRAMGCDTAQGYFLARPMPLPALEEFLRGAASGLPARDVA